MTEIEALIGDGKSQQRDKRKVLGLLSRRIECKSHAKIHNILEHLYSIDVQENTKSISKRLATLEEELLAANLAGEAETQTDERQPLTEIWEELDEDDNVICTLRIPFPCDFTDLSVKS